MRTYSSILLAGLTLGTSIAGCSGDLTLPSDRVPHELQAVAGDGQRGTVGDELPEPLVVRLTDAAGLPVSRTEVAFQSDVPGIVVDPSITATDDTGYASVRVRLGTTKGTQVVESRLAQTPDLTTTFELIAREQPDDRGPGHDGGDEEDSDQERHGDDDQGHHGHGGGHDGHDDD